MSTDGCFDFVELSCCTGGRCCRSCASACEKNISHLLPNICGKNTHSPSTCNRKHAMPNINKQCDAQYSAMSLLPFKRLTVPTDEISYRHHRRFHEGSACAALVEPWHEPHDEVSGTSFDHGCHRQQVSSLKQYGH